nr:MAG TPA: hypothetical protein [Caudoviricetes sp.]
MLWFDYNVSASKLQAVKLGKGKNLNWFFSFFYAFKQKK